MKKSLLFFLILFSLSIYSQNKSEETLGYYCGYSGSQTKLVLKFDSLLFEKKYKSIKSLLFSKIPGENFLAVVLCRRLAHEKIITLTKLESERMAELFKSKEKVPLCGGCTYHEEIEISKLLANQENTTMAMNFFFIENNKNCR